MADEIRSDIVVIGGGLAGVCAAISAARMGCRVTLAGDRPVLGGNSSSEIRMWTRGACGAGNLFSEEMGVLGELKLRNLQTNPYGNVIYWDEILLDGILAEENITLLLNTHITDVEMNDDIILSVHGFQLGSEREYCLRAKMFIDCTGDGTVATAANVPYRVGEESRTQHGERYAPVQKSRNTLGSSILYYTKKLDHPVPFIAPEYIHGMDFVEKIINHGGHIVDEKQNGSDYWWFEYGGAMDTIRDAQEINLELKKLALGVWNYIKNSGKFDADNLTLEWIGNIAGKRESRRMITDYVLTQVDILENRHFEDNAFYGGWYLDFHPSEGVYSKEKSCTQIPVRTYAIPIRTLFNSIRPNLLVGGRIIGTTHAAFTSSRIMDTCALSGQAAGTLAAFCIRNRQTPAEQAEKNIQNIQQQLLKDDMLIIGERNRDPEDLARTAEITASSFITRFSPKPAGLFPLEQDAFVNFPLPKGTKQVKVLIDSKQDCTLHIDMFTSPLPSRLCPGTFLSSVNCDVKRGRDLVLDMPEVEKNCFITAIFHANSHVMVRTTDAAPTGFLMGNQWSMEHVYPCIAMDLADLYNEKKLVNGFNRPYIEPNLWISKAEPQPCVTLEWEQPVKITQVLLYFDPDLSKEIPSSFTEHRNENHMLVWRGAERPVQLVEAFAVWVRRGRQWIKVKEISDNWRRLCTIQLLETAETDAIKVTFGSKASGAHTAQMFEIRVY